MKIFLALTILAASWTINAQDQRILIPDSLGYIRLPADFILEQENPGEWAIYKSESSPVYQIELRASDTNIEDQPLSEDVLDDILRGILWHIQLDNPSIHNTEKYIRTFNGNKMAVFRFEGSETAENAETNQMEEWSYAVRSYEIPGPKGFIGLDFYFFEVVNDDILYISHNDIIDSVLSSLQFIE
jgi:hypothetical protein